MPSRTSYVIAGAGLAGAKAAEALRERGYDGPLTLIGDEHDRPYERPPLSKDYLQGKTDREAIYVHPPSWYADHDIRLRLGQRVTSIDPAGHAVTLSDGACVDYANLLMTTGSSPRPLAKPGDDLAGVHYLRRLDDSDRIKDAIGRASRIAIVGAGWIGLETAAAARAADVQVTVLETAQLPLLRVLGPQMAQVFADIHRAHNMDLRCGVQVEEITGANGHVDGIRLGDGSHIPADAVIVAVGIVPNSQLALAAGLDVDNGVRVDAQLRSSHPDIYAAGDVANAYHPLLGKHIRVEHWANALHQPQAAAKAMVGQAVAYDRIPYFFTDQYDLGMEYHGYVEPDGYDELVVRGDLAHREFIAFWLSRGRVLAGMNVNIWGTADPIQAFIRSGQRIDQTKLADPQVPLEALVCG